MRQRADTGSAQLRVLTQTLLRAHRNRHSRIAESRSNQQNNRYITSRPDSGRYLHVHLHQTGYFARSAACILDHRRMTVYRDAHRQQGVWQWRACRFAIYTGGRSLTLARRVERNETGAATLERRLTTCEN